MQATILVVDDEAPIREMIKHVLDLEGFHCIEAEDANQAHALIVDRNPDLVLLDWMLPQTSGIELIRRLKRSQSIELPPVIMLTAKAEEQNRIQGLNEGADDYISKPFSPRELIARVNAVLRRYGGAASDKTINVDQLKLDTVSHRVYIGDEVLSIGPTEYKLLLFFMSHQERAYTRGQLLDQVWGGNVYIEERTIDVHIRRLRKALLCKNTSIDYGPYIQTVRGIGYRFSTTVETKAG